MIHPASFAGLAPLQAAQDPGAPTAQAETPAAGPPAAAGASTFLKWTVAVALLWLILTGMHEYGGNSRDVATGLALLILLGVLFAKGPQAAQNLQGAL